MKLELINHPEVLVIDEGLREKLLAGVAGAGIGAAGLLGGMGMMGGGGEPADPQGQHQVDNDFWSTGTGTQRDGTVYSSVIEQNQRVAEAKAIDNVAQFLGTNRLPPGLETRTEEQDGYYKVTVTLSQEGMQHAKDFAGKMGGSGPQSGKIHNDSDL